MIVIVSVVFGLGKCTFSYIVSMHYMNVADQLNKYMWSLKSNGNDVNAYLNIERHHFLHIISNSIFVSALKYTFMIFHIRMVSPAVALAFLPLLLTLLIKYRFFFMLFYRAVLVRIWKDLVSGLSREQRAYQYVLTHAIPGDPDSILDAFDIWCSKIEFISNIGPKKGEKICCFTTVCHLHVEITIIGAGLLCAGKILDRLLLEHSPLTVLELGAHCGYSTVRIARALPLGARLYSIEMDQNNAAIAEKIIRLAGFDDNTVRRQEEQCTHMLLSFSYI